MEEGRGFDIEFRRRGVVGQEQEGSDVARRRARRSPTYLLDIRVSDRDDRHHQSGRNATGWGWGAAQVVGVENDEGKLARFLTVGSRPRYRVGGGIRSTIVQASRDYWQEGGKKARYRRGRSAENQLIVRWLSLGGDGLDGGC